MITRVPPGTWETLSFPSSQAAGDTAYQLPIDPRLRVRGRGGRTTDATMVSRDLNHVHVPTTDRAGREFMR